MRLAEELMGEEGFSGASSLLYHLHSPSAITGVEPWPLDRSPLTPQRPSPALAPAGPPDARRRRPGHRPPDSARQSLRDHLLGRRRRSSELYRNAAGDELVYLLDGSATLQSVFGALTSRPGTTWSSRRRRPTAGSCPRHGARVRALVIEAAGHVTCHPAT